MGHTFTPTTGNISYNVYESLEVECTVTLLELLAFPSADYSCQWETSSLGDATYSHRYRWY